MHLDAVGMDDLRSERTDGETQAGKIARRRPSRTGAAGKERETRSAVLAGPPFAETREDRRERHDPNIDAKPSRARHERPVGRGNQPELPRWVLLHQAGQHLEQRGLGAAQPAGRVQKQNPHNRRRRTMIMSSGWMMSVGLASISLLL